MQEADDKAQSKTKPQTESQSRANKIDYGTKWQTPDTQTSTGNKRPQQQKPTTQTADAPSWELRVGTFSKQDNATKLKRSINDDFPNASGYIRIIDGRKGKLYIVVLGPWKRHKEAIRMQNLVEFQYGLKSILGKQR